MGLTPHPKKQFLILKNSMNNSVVYVNKNLNHEKFPLIILNLRINSILEFNSLLILQKIIFILFSDWKTILKMKILIRYCYFWGNYTTHTLEINLDLKLPDLKNLISMKFGIPVSEIIMKFSRDGFLVFKNASFFFYVILD